MPGYYVPKKNRCECEISGNDCCVSPFPLLFASSSSMNTSVDKSSTVYNSDKSTEGIGNGVGKGTGNARFMGSGGNSYDAYLAKKKGKLYCNCNVNK